MASQLRAASQKSSGAFGGFPTPSQFIEDPDVVPLLSQPHHEVVSSSQIPDDLPRFSFTPLPEETNPVASSQDDLETLSQKEQRLAKVTLHT